MHKGGSGNTPGHTGWDLLGLFCHADTLSSCMAIRQFRQMKCYSCVNYSSWDCSQMAKQQLLPLAGWLFPQGAWRANEYVSLKGPQLISAQPWHGWQYGQHTGHHVSPTPGNLTVPALLRPTCWADAKLHSNSTIICQQGAGFFPLKKQNSIRAPHPPKKKAKHQPPPPPPTHTKKNKQKKEEERKHPYLQDHKRFPSSCLTSLFAVFCPFPQTPCT